MKTKVVRVDRVGGRVRRVVMEVTSYYGTLELVWSKSRVGELMATKTMKATTSLWLLEHPEDAYIDPMVFYQLRRRAYAIFAGRKKGTVKNC